MNTQQQNNLPKKLSELTATITLIVGAIIAIGVPILQTVNLIDDNWITRNGGSLTLFVLGLLLTSVLLERFGSINEIQNSLETIVGTYALGVQYLSDSETVNNNLISIVNKSERSIMCLGSKSKNSKYLEAIEHAVKRGVSYKRFLDGNHINHELHLHLERVLKQPDVQIAWTYTEKFGNLTVTEQDTILAFPGPSKNRFFGLRIPGEKNSSTYIQYFYESLSSAMAKYKGLYLTSPDGIEALCRDCSKNIPKDIDKLIEEIERLQKIQPVNPQQAVVQQTQVADPPESRH